MAEATATQISQLRLVVLLYILNQIYAGDICRKYELERKMFDRAHGQGSVDLSLLKLFFNGAPPFADFFMSEEQLTAAGHEENGNKAEK